MKILQKDLFVGYCLLFTLTLNGCTKKPCGFTVPTVGSSKTALIDRVLLNTEYYFSDTPYDLRADIYLRPELGKLSSGAGRDSCVDDARARASFRITIESAEATSATVRVDSLLPDQFNWFTAWEGTFETWILENGNWKLHSSRTEDYEHSDFIQTYFGSN